MNHGKFSEDLIYAAIEFSRRCREEIGEELGTEKVTAMFDAFDPELKGQVFMTLLAGTIGTVRIERGSGYEVKKINAIKGIRGITGWGLKESKDFIDSIDPGKQQLLNGCFKMEEIRALREQLHDSGYFVR